MGNFYAENTARRYPFDDTLPPGLLELTGTATTFDLPMQSIVDAGFIVGSPADYDPAQGQIFLASISRTGPVLTFSVRCTAPALAGIALLFRRSIADTLWATSWSDATNLDGTEVVGDVCGTAFVWRGFLATGDLTALAGLIPDGGVAVPLAAALVFEPTLCQSCRDDYVRTLNVANEGRLLAVPPGQASSPFEPFYHLQTDCIVGAVIVEPLYSWTMDQDASASSLTLGASVGAGAGQPCVEIPAFPGEVPPDGSPYLTGGPACSSLILTVNGLTGSTIQIAGGLGVAVSADPDDPHGLIVDCNRVGMSS